MQREGRGQAGTEGGPTLAQDSASGGQESQAHDMEKEKGAKRSQRQRHITRVHLRRRDVHGWYTDESGSFMMM